MNMLIMVKVKDESALSIRVRNCYPGKSLYCSLFIWSSGSVLDSVSRDRYCSGASFKKNSFH